MKPKAALIRGVGRESGHWDPDFITLLRESYDVTLLDYPGCGPFAKEKFPLSFDAVLEHLDKQLEKHVPTLLIAVSLGGMVALQWVKKSPEKFTGLVLINSSAKDLGSVTQRISIHALATLIRASTHYRNPERAEEIIVELISNNKNKHLATIKNWTQVALQRPTHIPTVIKQLWLGSRFESPAAPLKVPLQVLASAHDRFVDPACSKKLADKYNAPLALHNTAGHDLVVDDPEWVFKQIQLLTSRRTTV